MGRILPHCCSQPTPSARGCGGAQHHISASPVTPPAFGCSLRTSPPSRTRSSKSQQPPKKTILIKKPQHNGSFKGHERKQLWSSSLPSSCLPPFLQCSSEQFSFEAFLISSALDSISGFQRRPCQQPDRDIVRLREANSPLGGIGS